MPQKFVNGLKNILSAGKSLSSKKNMLQVIALSCFLWVLHAFIYLLIAQGLGIQLGLAEVLLIVSFSSLSAMIPASPGFVGTFQTAFATIFVALGLNPELGLSMSIIIHLGAYASTILIGVFSANRLGVSVFEVFNKAKNVSGENLNK